MITDIKCPFCSLIFDPIDDFSEGISSGLHDVSCPGCGKDIQFDIVIKYQVSVVSKTKKGVLK